MIPLPASRDYKIVALDPGVRGRNGRPLLTSVEIPNETLDPGPSGYRIRVVGREAGANGAFRAANLYATAMFVLSRFERALGRRVRWRLPGHQIAVHPYAFEDLNAFYSREDGAIYFGRGRGAEGKVYTCLSHEVIAHETSHALLDGMRGGYVRPSSPDQAAFHEGFADIVALLSVLSIREVLSAGLDPESAGARDAIRASALTETALKRSLPLGLAREIGEAASGVRGQALRRSIGLVPGRRLKDTAEFQECHRRGELLVASVLGAFLKVWKARIDLCGELHKGMVSRIAVVDAAAETAEHLLTMAIRAIDYCPPTDLLFGDFLSAILTADYELQPDDSRCGYRRALRAAFAAFGFLPESGDAGQAEPGLWGPPEHGQKLHYGATHFESMRHDRNEVFHFVWENRRVLGLDRMARTVVDDVMPSHRAGADGFVLRETVATYSQEVSIAARELKRFGLRRPDGMPKDVELKLYGGGALIFDEAGRLKYHVRNRIRSAQRQNPRLEYLWRTGGLEARTSFAELHGAGNCAPGANRNRKESR